MAGQTILFIMCAIRTVLVQFKTDNKRAVRADGVDETITMTLFAHDGVDIG